MIALTDHDEGFQAVFLLIVLFCPLGVVSNPMVQQPVMSGGLDTGSPITFPEEQEDPRVSGENNAGGGIWGFFKVKLLKFDSQTYCELSQTYQK